MKITQLPSRGQLIIWCVNVRACVRYGCGYSDKLYFSVKVTSGEGAEGSVVVRRFGSCCVLAASSGLLFADLSRATLRFSAEVSKHPRPSALHYHFALPFSHKTSLTKMIRLVSQRIVLRVFWVF